MEYIAHVRTSGECTKEFQTVEEHCRKTAFYAQTALADIHLGEGAYLAGLVHDAGKYKTEFQKYLLEGTGECGTVNHTFAGCRMLMEHFHHGEEQLTCELLSYATGAHHGLFDCVQYKKPHGFDYRMQKKNIHYTESKENFLSHCAGWDELENRFEKAHQELFCIYEKCAKLSELNEKTADEDACFYLSLLARLILSAVIEGDRRDTAEFMNHRFEKTYMQNMGKMWETYLEKAERKIDSFSMNTKINQSRRKISDICRCFADRPAGIYRLNVPTGAGKTLSSLRYALAHAARWQKRRIIFVTPLLSILDQNAQVIRNYINDDAVILEHHSNVILTNTDHDELDKRELAIDSWHAPIILTTLVQLLNTFFLGKTTSVRRFHALCNAVVVIDEVQTVPHKLLSLFNLTVNFLSYICNTTFLLCSATQPCYEKTEHPLNYSPDCDAVPFDPVLWEPFKRTEITDKGNKCLQELPDFIQTVLQETRSLLVICNTRKEAVNLFKNISFEDTEIFHLSASMCMQHRRDTLKKVEESLKNSRQGGKKTLCISTQVLEAGVDISFERVIRLTAGMDNIIQAAGRCNRNGENEGQCSPVYIVNCPDEKLGPLQSIKDAKDASVSLLNAFKRKPELFENDLSSDEAIQWYYQKLFHNESSQSRLHDYPADENDTLFSMLSDNEKNLCEGSENYFLNQSFKRAGDLFQVLEENTQDAVVPYGKGKQLIEELASFPEERVEMLLPAWNEKAKPYTVSLYENTKEKVQNGLRSIHGVLVLYPEFYDPQIGLDPTENIFLEV